MDIEYQKASRKYSVSHMNNSKWFKLFEAWANSSVDVEVAHWRFIDSPHEETYPLPELHDLQPTRFADGRFQPREFKWILSIFVPKSFRPVPDVGFERHQDVESLKRIADGLGQFPVYVVENGIEVRGYEK
jgi:hypothetical protein